MDVLVDYPPHSSRVISHFVFVFWAKGFTFPTNKFENIPVCFKCRLHM